jgi:TPR repeat protein
METNDWKMTPERVKQFENYMAKALEGDAEAQSNLGWCYYVGTGVPEDCVQAVSWCLKAAEQGDADAQCLLGELYIRGLGVAENKIEGCAFLKLAAIPDGEEEASNRRRTNAHWQKRLSKEVIAAAEERSKELQKEIEAKIAAKKAGK